MPFHSIPRSADGTVWTTGYTGTGIAAIIAVPASGNYTFRVKAMKSGQPDSAWTYGSNACQITVTCGAPARISVTPTSTGAVSTTWTTSSTAGVTYQVEYSTDGTNWSAGYTGTAITASIAVPVSGTYSFRVRATKAGCTDSCWTGSAGSCVVTKK